MDAIGNKESSEMSIAFVDNGIYYRGVECDRFNDSNKNIVIIYVGLL